MSSHKKRRELNRATAEHTHARIRAELAQGIVNFENLMEHAMGVRIKELEHECDALQADNARLRDALDEAATSLETIQLRSYGDESYLNHMGQVRGFAGSRSRVAKEALAATPEQSLVEYRNKVIEECAVAAEQVSPHHIECGMKLARAIRARKEQGD